MTKRQKDGDGLSDEVGFDLAGLGPPARSTVCLKPEVDIALPRRESFFPPLWAYEEWSDNPALWPEELRDSPVDRVVAHLEWVPFHDEWLSETFELRQALAIGAKHDVPVSEQGSS